MDASQAFSPSAPSAGALFLAFLRIGLSGFGGVLPFARRALVERLAWMNEAEFTETLALCQSLPGPNIVNLSVVVGARFAGARGAAASALGLIGAPMVIVIALVSVWSWFGARPGVAHAVTALGAAAAGLVIATAAKMARPIITGSPVSGLISVAIFATVGLLRLPLPWVLVLALPVSVAVAWRRR